MAVLKRPVWLLTDYGGDNAVGRLKGALKKIDPFVEFHDLDHKVPPQCVLAGSWRLLASIPSLPRDSVIVAVVDPHVGSDRKGIVIELETGHTIIGPADNGLLSAAVQLYGLRRAYFLENPEFFNGTEVLFKPREDITGEFFSSVDFELGKREDLGYSTFDGLRIFAPVGAHIASGIDIKHFGNEAKHDDIPKLFLPLEVDQLRITGCIADIDEFGNIRLAIPFKLLERIGVKLNDRIRITISRNGDSRIDTRDIKVVEAFSDVEVGKYLALAGSCGSGIDVCIRDGNAAREIGDSRKVNLIKFLELENKGGLWIPKNKVTIENAAQAVATEPIEKAA